MTTLLPLTIVICSFLFLTRLHFGITRVERVPHDPPHHRLRISADAPLRQIEEVVDQIQSEIIGALLGAIVGAFAGAWVSRHSIRYDRRIAACSAMQALVDEARFNAHVVQHVREVGPESSPSALERQAFDAALPVLHVLPPALRERSREARSKILVMMHLEEVLESSQTKPGKQPTAIIQKRQGLIETLPAELESLADDVAMFVKTDCESRWFGSRSPSSH